MTRRRLLIISGSIIATLVSAIGGLVVFFAVALDTSEAGSPQLAREWKTKLEARSSLEEAQRQDPEILGRRFQNGEWVFGYARDSHNRWHRGGGTLVVKDSRGNVRVFFGHVCGPHCGGEFQNSTTHNLDQFYKGLHEHWQFVEQKIP